MFNFNSLTYLLLATALLQVSSKRISNTRKFERTIKKRGPLEEAQSIQDVTNYLICTLASQISSAASALGISSISPVCIAPPTLSHGLVPVTTSSTVNACSSSDPEICYQQGLALKGHNDFRALHHVEPLTWNDTLADAALRWVTNCQFHHSGGSLLPFTYGENLYTSTLTTPGTDMNTVVEAYNKEESLYDYNNPAFSERTGHFTQVVWKATTQVGCAIINCPVDTLLKYSPISSYSACVYNPAGNYAEEYAANVFAP